MLLALIITIPLSLLALLAFAGWCFLAVTHWLAVRPRATEHKEIEPPATLNLW